MLNMPTCAGLLLARSYLNPVFDVVADNTKESSLFLRSFRDDGSPEFATGIGVLSLSLETRLANHFRRFGAFVGVRSPAQRFPLLGATRVRFSDGSWQNDVLKLLDAANLIVVLAGVTESAVWELQAIVQRNYLQKAIIVFPPPTLDEYSAMGTPPVGASHRFRAVCESLSDTDWRYLFKIDVDPRDIRSMSFSPSGRITIIKSKSRFSSSSQLGAMISHYLSVPRPSLGT